MSDRWKQMSLAQRIVESTFWLGVTCLMVFVLCYLTAMPLAWLFEADEPWRIGLITSFIGLAATLVIGGFIALTYIVDP